MTSSVPAVTPAEILQWAEEWDCDNIFPHGDWGIYIPAKVYRSSPKDYRYLFAVPVENSTAWDVRVWRVVSDDDAMRALGIHVALTQPPLYASLVEADMRPRPNPFYPTYPASTGSLMNYVPYYLNSFRDVMMQDVPSQDFSKIISIAEILAF